MDTVKAVVSIGEASIQLEGPQEFVEKYLDHYHPLIQRWHELPKRQVEAPKVAEVKKEEVPSKRARVAKPGAPSCGDRIRALIDENYFAEPKICSEVAIYLKDQKGFTYPDKNVASTLNNIIKSKSGRLRRFKEGGIYKYTNP